MFAGQSCRWCGPDSLAQYAPVDFGSPSSHVAHCSLKGLEKEPATILAAVQTFANHCTLDIFQGLYTVNAYLKMGNVEMKEIHFFG